MKFLLYGEAFPNSMVSFVNVALKKLGHDVEIFDFTKFLYRDRGLTIWNRGLDRILSRSVTNQINSSLEKKIQNSRPDILFVSKGVHIDPSVLSAAKVKNILTINWNPDDFFNPRNSSANLIKCFSLYDLIVCARTHLWEEYYARGAQKLLNINWYYDPSICCKVDITNEERLTYGSELSFIGTWSKYREDFFKNFDSFDFKIWGGGWDKASRSFKRKIKVIGRATSPLELPKVISASNINFNLFTPLNRDNINMKNFEIPACGGFLLTQRTKQVTDLFAEGVDIACYQDNPEAIEKVKYYLLNKTQREEIAKSGYQRVLTGRHTLFDRVQELVKEIESFKKIYNR